MAASLGDLIQCVDFQTYLEQQVLNVYYYRVTSVTGLSDGYLETLNTHWEEGVLTPILEIQLDTLLHVSREWRNMTNGADLFTASEVIEGGQSGGASSESPSYVSAGFILRRESLVTRNGYKRFAGIPDENIAGNDLVGMDAIVAAIEVGLAADLTEGLATLAEPVIVKRPIEVPVEEYLYSSIGSAQFRGLGSQNSRKRGRGI